MFISEQQAFESGQSPPRSVNAGLGIAACQSQTKLIRIYQVTFHRAFDVVRDLDEGRFPRFREKDDSDDILASPF